MGKDKGNNCGTGYQAKTERAGNDNADNERMAADCRGTKSTGKWQTMTLEELEAEKLRFQGKLPFKLQMVWLKQKADRGTEDTRLNATARSRPVRISTK